MASRHALDGSTVRISSTRAWGDVLHPMPEAANQYQGGPTPPYRLAPSTSTRPVDVFTPFGLLDTSAPFSSLSARTMSSPQHQSSGGMRLSKQIHNVQANKQHPAVASNHTAETMSLGPHRTYHPISISSGLSSVGPSSVSPASLVSSAPCSSITTANSADAPLVVDTMKLAKELGHREIVRHMFPSISDPAIDSLIHQACAGMFSFFS
jgi:hypothetical protein